MIIRFGILAALLLLMACAQSATQSTSQKYAQNNTDSLNNLAGHSTDDLIQSLGVPSSTFKSAGKEFYIYDESESVLTPATPTLIHSTISGSDIFTSSIEGQSPNSFQLSCRVTISIMNGLVETWNAEGNDCQLYAGQAKRLAPECSHNKTESIERLAYCYKSLDLVVRANEKTKNPFLNIENVEKNKDKKYQELLARGYRQNSPEIDKLVEGKMAQASMDTQKLKNSEQPICMAKCSIHNPDLEKAHKCASRCPTDANEAISRSDYYDCLDIKAYQTQFH